MIVRTLDIMAIVVTDQSSLQIPWKNHYLRFISLVQKAFWFGKVLWFWFCKETTKERVLIEGRPTITIENECLDTVDELHGICQKWCCCRRCSCKVQPHHPQSASNFCQSHNRVFASHLWIFSSLQLPNFGIHQTRTSEQGTGARILLRIMLWLSLSFLSPHISSCQYKKQMQQTLSTTRTISSMIRMMTMNLLVVG